MCKAFLNVKANMQSQAGFSLPELLVSIIIASVLMLTVGAISSISMTSHNKVRNESELFGDLAYGLKVIQKKVRETGGLSAGGQAACVNTSCLWADEDQLIIDNVGPNNEAIGIYNATLTRIELITVPFTGDFEDLQRNHVENNKNLIMVFDRNADLIEFDFNFNSELNKDCSVSGTALGPRTTSLCLDGQKRDIPFELSTQVKRRAQ